MKKQYLSPLTIAVHVEACQLICGTLGKSNIPNVNFNDAIIDDGGRAADSRSGIFFDDED